MKNIEIVRWIDIPFSFICLGFKFWMVSSLHILVILFRMYISFSLSIYAKKFDTTSKFSSFSISRFEFFVLVGLMLCFTHCPSRVTLNLTWYLTRPAQNAPHCWTTGPVQTTLWGPWRPPPIEWLVYKMNKTNSIGQFIGGMIKNLKTSNEVNLTIHHHW